MQNEKNVLRVEHPNPLPQERETTTSAIDVAYTPDGRTAPSSIATNAATATMTNEPRLTHLVHPLLGERAGVRASIPAERISIPPAWATRLNQRAPGGNPDKTACSRIKPDKTTSVFFTTSGPVAENVSFQPTACDRMRKPELMKGMMVKGIIPLTFWASVFPQVLGFSPVGAVSRHFPPKMTQVSRLQVLVFSPVAEFPACFLCFYFSAATAWPCPWLLNP
jgi:hypothetical protein